MAYTKEQQDRIDAAVKRNDAAKKNWSDANTFWTDNFVNLRCYKDTKYPISDAVSWFTPNDSSCTSGTAACSTTDKKDCKNKIALVISRIGSIRDAYAEFNAAEANYKSVISAIENEVKNDPAVILQQHQIDQSATVSKYKWIFAIVVVVILVIGFFVYKKFFKS